MSLTGRDLNEARMDIVCHLREARRNYYPLLVDYSASINLLNEIQIAYMTDSMKLTASHVRIDNVSHISWPDAVS